MPTAPEAKAPVDHLAGVVNPDLVEETDDGSLPKIPIDGRQPWIKYSRPFEKADRRPRIAITVTSLDLPPSRSAGPAAKRNPIRFQQLSWTYRSGSPERGERDMMSW